MSEVQQRMCSRSPISLTAWRAKQTPDCWKDVRSECSIVLCRRLTPSWCRAGRQRHSDWNFHPHDSQRSHHWLHLCNTDTSTDSGASVRKPRCSSSHGWLAAGRDSGSGGGGGGGARPACRRGQDRLPGVWILPQVGRASSNRLTAQVSVPLNHHASSLHHDAQQGAARPPLPCCCPQRECGGDGGRPPLAAATQPLRAARRRGAGGDSIRCPLPPPLLDRL